MGNQNESVYQEFYHKRNTYNTPLVIVEKMIQAPVAEVFYACSEADMVKQWWGPEAFSSPVVKMDFKVGGKYLSCMKSDDGKMEIWAVGQFLEIIPNRRIVSSEHPSNSEGVEISARDAEDGPFADEGDSYITIEFENKNQSETKLTLSHEGLPARMHDNCIAGWSSSLDKLKRLVEKH